MSRLRNWKKECGTAMVEFAVVLPIFLFVAWCIIDFGRAFYTQNSLATAVREGARYAAVLDDPNATASVTAIKAKVTNSFNAFGGPGIPAAKILISANAKTAGTVTITVDRYQWLTTTPINIFPGGLKEMTKAATFRMEREPT